MEFLSLSRTSSSWPCIFKNWDHTKSLGCDFLRIQTLREFRGHNPLWCPETVLHTLYRFSKAPSLRNIIPHNLLQQIHLGSKCVKWAFLVFCDQPLSGAKRLFFKIIAQRAVCWPAASTPTGELAGNTKSHPRLTVWWVCCLENIKFCCKGQENKWKGWNS